MLTPNRRQFVASMAGLPLLLQTPVGAQPGLTNPAPDAVLAQILSDFRDLVNEGETRPASRKTVMRSIETILAIEAAHLATHYDPALQKSLKRRETRMGRAALIDEAVALAHSRRHSAPGAQATVNASVSPERIDAAITQLAERGVAGALRDLHRSMRAVRMNSPEALQPVALLPHEQYDYCADLRWQIEMLEGIVAIFCALALAEPTPIGEAGCAAIMITLGYLLLIRLWFCF